MKGKTQRRETTSKYYFLEKRIQLHAILEFLGCKGRIMVNYQNVFCSLKISALRTYRGSKPLIMLYLNHSFPSTTAQILPKLLQLVMNMGKP